LFDNEADWLLCTGSVEDPSLWELICGPRPPADDPPPPADDPPPPADDPPPPADDPPPPADDPPPPADDPPPPADDPPPPVEEPPVVQPPPPPPPPAQCAQGKHSGHSVVASGSARGHVCAGDNHRHRGHHRHDHGRRHGHVAKAKAAVHQFLRWCHSFVAHHGRR
jgi:hypothetical protein